MTAKIDLFRGNEALLDAVGEGRFHALLLLAPRGGGAGYAARLAAARFLANNERLVLLDAHPDCLVVGGEGKSNQIKTKTLGDALFEINRGSALSERRAVIIDDASRLNDFSAARLLKTLEEPPRSVMFILTAAGADSVIPTVVSRCGVALLNMPTEQELIKAFGDSEELRLCISVFGERVEYIEQALGNRKRIAEVKAASELFELLLSRDALGIMAALNHPRERLLTLTADTLSAAERYMTKTGDGADIAAALMQLADDLSRFVSQNAATARFTLELTSER